jgi:hypothetical protein
MGKSLGISLAKRDDPIFKEGPTFYTRKSDRISTRPKPPTPTTKGESPHLNRETPDPEEPEE